MKKKRAAQKAYEKARTITSNQEQIAAEQEKQRIEREEELELEKEIAKQTALLKAEQLRRLAGSSS